MSIIAGLILTNMYEDTGYKGSPIIGTSINVFSAVVAVWVAYKPFNKNNGKRPVD
ncbi:hypothetical protein [Bacillus sp. AFS015802]|uniref:hypothetical protein n=1 Tax=Bacillus sp. AFS015802 TaxID=2033486 RepID=UPI0015CEFCA5|nr:hypothetical protein [Bacillus sp. AFS015802]